MTIGRRNPANGTQLLFHFKNSKLWQQIEEK